MKMRGPPCHIYELFVNIWGVLTVFALFRTGIGREVKTYMYNKLLNRYYTDILLYCCARLCGDQYAAEDCAQEVFLALYRKLSGLDLDRDIRPWLYAAADREILAYRRRHPATVDLDAIPEPAELPDFTDSQAETVLDRLPEKERRLLEAYYSGADREQLARHMGITVNALYLRVRRIRKQLLQYVDQMQKGGGV